MLSRRREAVPPLFFGPSKILVHNGRCQCKEGKTHNAEGKILLQAGCHSGDTLHASREEGWASALVPGKFALVSDACGNSLVRWPRQGCVLAGEPNTQLGPETPTEELAKRSQRFALLQTIMQRPMHPCPGTRAHLSRKRQRRQCAGTPLVYTRALLLK